LQRSSQERSSRSGPDGPDLWRVENYREFLAARRRLLADAANRLLEDLLEGQSLQGEAAGEPAPTDLESTPTEDETETSAAVLVGIAVSEEDDEKLECAYWAEEHGLPSPHIDLVYVDVSSGEELAVFDLAWPEGLQPGFSQPAAILLNEPREVEEVANRAGYRFFTTVEEFKEHVEKAILAKPEEAMAS
jgi:hypothetical protein